MCVCVCASTSPKDEFAFLNITAFGAGQMFSSRGPDVARGPPIGDPCPSQSSIMIIAFILAIIVGIVINKPILDCNSLSFCLIISIDLV